MTDPRDLSESLYDDLARRARAILGMRRLGDAPETVSLVNQACLRLLKGGPREFKTRAEFLAFCAQAMRSVLIDLARSRNAEVRGGGRRHAPLDAAGEDAALSRPPEAEILDVHEQLSRLKDQDPRLARLVELKFFGGCTFAEIAEVLGGSPDGIEAEWRFAKVWLRSRLGGE